MKGRSMLPIPPLHLPLPTSQHASAPAPAPHSESNLPACSPAAVGQLRQVRSGTRSAE